jgi:hypothetical protein
MAQPHRAQFRRAGQIICDDSNHFTVRVRRPFARPRGSRQVFYLAELPRRRHAQKRQIRCEK